MGISGFYIEVIGVILVLYKGYIGVIQGLHWGNIGIMEKENGNYMKLLSRV